MKSNTLIIICMVVLIFLGILWLKFDSGIKEGLETQSSTKIAEISKEILNSVNTKLKAGGIDASTYTSALPGAIDKITDLVNQSLSLGGDKDDVALVDLNTVTDTTGSDLYPYKSFLTGNKFSDGFCKSYIDPIVLNQKCGALTPENCNQTDCCIVLNGSKCVAGNAQGPNYQTDENGNDIDYAYYSYKNDCYGSCGKGLSKSANPCSAFIDSDTKISEPCIKRMWQKAGCTNSAYITPSLLYSLRDDSKLAIKLKFKSDSLDEPNFEKCYGPIEERWPLPCLGTKDTSYGLSARCLKHLLKNVGCPNQSMINDAYVIANKLEPKSAMINKFTSMVNAGDDDDGLLTKCYGGDETVWPNPCMNTNDFSNVLDGTLPKRCAYKLFQDTTTCTSRDKVNELYSYVNALSASNKNALLRKSTDANKYSKAGLITQWTNDKNNLQSNRFECYGVNPNTWDNDNTEGFRNINKIPSELDPCKTINPDMNISDVPSTCITRLQGSDIFPTTECRSNKIKNDITSKVKSGLTNGKGKLIDVLIDVENQYQTSMAKFCGPVREYIFGIGSNDQIYSRPTSDFNEGWKLVSNPATDGNYLSIIQLSDKSFLSSDRNYKLRTHKTVPSDAENPMIEVPLEPCCCVSVVKLDNGNIIHCGTDGRLYYRESLNFGWKQIPNSELFGSIALINTNVGARIAGIGRDLFVYTRPATINEAPWSRVPLSSAVWCITQLKNGKFIGIGTNGSLFIRETMNLDDNISRWRPLPNPGGGWVRFITTVNV